MRFTIHKSEKSGDFWFRIVATNGNVLVNSQMYKDKRSAISTIESIQKSAADAAVVDET